MDHFCHRDTKILVPLVGNAGWEGSKISFRKEILKKDVGGE